ncbi:S1/P1 nuclease [Reinekea thalattae]|uniref:S1/P1 nuclease n=1 Tax=Reinekea thalattae TaxID=2593301 RepID=A0A5C8Z3H5_9GAMM|nr:S1/P1 nuclease [Reinekea thalattae]TXR51480.1 S1/P1 nuclease [Reinekea thalattae]
MAWCTDRRQLCFHWLSGRKAQSQRVIAALGLSLAPALFAFEQSGHQMVAQLMIPYLNSGAQAEMQRLLGDNWQRSLVRNAASVEAEMTRPSKPHLRALQFTLFDVDDEGFDPAKHCPNAVCSVGAILESEQVLQISSYSVREKREALQYLMHYTLELHIPMNSGLIRDEGGQKIFLDGESLQPINLSFIWNYDLYRRLDAHWFGFAQELYREMRAMEDLDSWVESDRPQDWAYETNRIAVEQAYPLAAEGRYSAELMNEGQKILELQLMKAAYRTAFLLNKMHPEPTELMTQEDSE